MKQVVKKINSGIKDEKDAIKYYWSFSQRQKNKMSGKEKKNLMEAKKDERRHLRYLDENKKAILGRHGR